MCWFLEEYTRNTMGYNVGKAMANHSLHKDINYQQIAGYCSTNINKFQTCRFQFDAMTALWILHILRPVAGTYFDHAIIASAQIGGLNS